MYDALYETIPQFERDSGVAVDLAAQLPHPELNAYVKGRSSRAPADLDLLSTHTKYAPSQANGWRRSTTSCPRMTRRTCCRAQRSCRASAGGSCRCRATSTFGSCTTVAICSRTLRRARAFEARYGRAACRARDVDRARRRRGVLHSVPGRGGFVFPRARLGAVRLVLRVAGRQPAAICSTWRCVLLSTRRPACGPRTIWPSCTIAGR